MAWENRNGNLYYYQKEREGNRVFSRYIGKGSLAYDFSILEEYGRKEKRHKRNLKRLEREEIEAVENQVNEICEMVKTLVDASLLANGWHQHKRQWRRKRNV